MKPTVNRNLQIGFGISLLLLIISAVVSYTSINGLLNSADMVRHTRIIIMNTEELLSNLKDAETGSRGYLLTGNSAFLEPYNGAEKKSRDSYNKLHELIKYKKAEEDLALFKQAIDKKFERMGANIEEYKRGKKIDIDGLKEGKRYMDDARKIAVRIESEEEQLLAERTESMNKFATYTPILVLIAALIAIIITLLSYRSIMREFNKRTALQKELEALNEETARRVTLIENMAEKVARGEYKSRITDTTEDTLGNLAASLNKMAASLEAAFDILAKKEWQQTGIATVSNTLMKEQNLQELFQKSLDELVHYTDARVGVLYSLENNVLKAASTHACIINENNSEIKLGNGMTGQAALDKKALIVKDMPENYLKISSALGFTAPKTLVIQPLVFNNETLGVIELGYSKDITEAELAYLDMAANNIAISINTGRSRQRVQQLLEETQTQSEELRTQQEELQQLNTELEERSQQIQASEEELRVSNEELEEKARMMEEQNQTIVEKNSQLELNGHELRKKGEDLQLSSKYKSEFLANMSHELRTPLNSILLLSKLLADNKKRNLDDDQEEYAKVINNQGRNLLELIDEILDLSRVESGKIKVEPEKVTLLEIQKDIESLFNPVANNKGVAFEVRISHALPETITTDKMRMEQVLKNLLSNAFKFTASGTVSLTIKSLRHTINGMEDEMIAFAVKDSGIGIAPDKQELVFQPFQQADGSTLRKYGGTGLGLSISREIAMMLGGEVTLDSEEGKGSTFTLFLPFNLIAEEKTEPVEHINGKQADAIPQPVFKAKKIPNEIEDDHENITEKDKVILIVEDDTALAKLLVKFSHERGYKAISVVQGDKALAAAQKYKPEGIILDIELPVMDGWAVLDALKKNPATRHIPVHIVSSMQAEKESLVKGSIDFAHKPLSMTNFEEIFDKLENVNSRKDKKVLIVKGDPIHTEALREYMVNEKIEIVIPDTLAEGIEFIKKDKVDCAIVDLSEHQKEGFEMLNYLKEHEELVKLPVIIYTGKNMQEKEIKKLEKYSDELVLKTVDTYKRVLEEAGLFIHLVEEDKASFRQRQAMGDILHGKNILVVDDDPRNIFALVQTLESYKINTVTANDGAEALKLLDVLPNLDAILMDMMMPVMDGYEAMRKIRANPKYKDMPIIAVTAKAMPEDRKRSIDAGASDYITKPVDADQLLSLLRVWLY